MSYKIGPIPDTATPKEIDARIRAAKKFRGKSKVMFVIKTKLR